MIFKISQFYFEKIWKYGTETFERTNFTQCFFRLFIILFQVLNKVPLLANWRSRNFICSKKALSSEWKSKKSILKKCSGETFSRIEIEKIVELRRLLSFFFFLEKYHGFECIIYTVYFLGFCIKLYTLVVHYPSNRTNFCTFLQSFCGKFEPDSKVLQVERIILYGISILSAFGFATWA